MIDLLGTWSLVSCISYRNGEGTPSFGSPPIGQIQYAADGKMSAFLMDPAWMEKGDPAAEGLSDFFSYAGRWTLTGDQVRHDIEICSIPKKVGTAFVRTLTPKDENNMELSTAPETSKSGAVYVTVLSWARVAAS
ncbi:MAG: lipocalin-like domain-containing protein [Pseudomonadales bacterium]